MKIRKATKKDLEELEKLYLGYNQDLERIVLKKYLYFKNKKKNYRFEVNKAIANTLKDKSSIILVAEQNNCIIGTVSGWTTEIKNDLFLDKVKFGYLQYLYVLPKFRGKGISSELKKELFNWLKTKKCDFVRLEVASTNPAIRAYEKWGFEIDSIKMVKELKGGFHPKR